MTDEKRSDKTSLIWLFIILFLIYFFASWFFMGTFIFSQELRSSSKKESMDKSFVIDKKIKLEFTGDSAIKYRNNFDIWFDKCKVATQVGIIPVYWTTTDESALIFNIEPKKDLDNWCLKFNNDRYFLSVSVHSQYRKVNSSPDSLTVNFFHCDAIEFKQIGTLRVKWE